MVGPRLWQSIRGRGSQNPMGSQVGEDDPTFMSASVTPSAKLSSTANRSRLLASILYETRKGREGDPSADRDEAETGEGSQWLTAC